MSTYGLATYGDRIADLYDEWYQGPGFDPAASVRFLAGLAGDGLALELGIGTGRVALPLKAAGVAVHGIDASGAMVAKLRAKPGGADIPVTLGTFASFDLKARFRVVYVVFNTFWALLTQDEQVDCFRAVARHLAPGGVFVIETLVPDPARYERGQRTQTNWSTADATLLEASRHDPIRQRVDTSHVLLEDGRPARVFPVRVRYVYLSELDLMARLAGMRLRERWSSWEKEPFGPASARHISVWCIDAT
jgi:SAM-dependent methyltransferase